jgi:hypothetical protein
MSRGFRLKNSHERGFAMQNDDRLLWASRYAERGWPVLPVWWPLSGGRCACGQPECSNQGKHPLVRRGLHSASTDPELVRRWWSRWPQANVGIRTGAPSGLLVVDVDGAAGMESMRTLVREHGSLRAAWTRSGSGGWHAYVRLSEGQRVPNSVGRLGPGLDVRGDGGSIVAPPSRHASGGTYGWTRPGVEPPPAPDWLVQLALPPTPAPVPPLRELVRHVSDRYGAAAVHAEADAVAGAPAGTRNHRLNLAAWRLGRLVAGGVVDEPIARDALLAAATSSGLPWQESVGTVRSGMRAGLRSPRQPRSRAVPPPSPAAAPRRSSSR